MKIKTFIDQFFAFTRKEFYHILRDRKTLLVLVVLPISQLLIFGFALNSSLTEMPTAVLDMSNDAMSRQIVAEIDASSTFKVVEHVRSMDEVDELFKGGRLSQVFVFMPGFEKEIKRTGVGNMQVIMDASLQINASTLESYILATLLSYQQKINAGRELPIQIIPEVKMRYNPRLNSAFHFVPGVIGIVLMLVCSMMASLAIVKEKESGTMEVLLVSPVRPPVIILAKLVPYLLVGMINIVVILLISVTILKVPVTGNIFLLFFVGTIYPVFVGVGDYGVGVDKDTAECHYHFYRGVDASGYHVIRFYLPVGFIVFGNESDSAHDAGDLVYLGSEKYHDQRIGDGCRLPGIVRVGGDHGGFDCY